MASTAIVAVPLASRSAVQWPTCASHCCSAADQAGHSLHTAQTGSHTGHTELAGQPHGATPYLWPATHPARTDRLEYTTHMVQSASRGARKWIDWLDLQDERRGRPSFCYPVELSGCGRAGAGGGRACMSRASRSRASCRGSRRSSRQERREG